MAKPSLTKGPSIIPGPRKCDCPACGKQMEPPAVSSSRYAPTRTGKTFEPVYICSVCGTNEALTGFFWQARYLKLIETKDAILDQKGFEPWG